MVNDARSRLSGECADETIVGGPVRGKRGRAVADLTTKTRVFGAVEVIGYTDNLRECAEKAGYVRLATAVKVDEELIVRFF